MAFGVQPAVPGQPAAVPQRFPKQLRVLVNGVDLGPGITTLNFVGAGWTVTRGTGEDINTVTVALA